MCRTKNLCFRCSISKSLSSLFLYPRFFFFLLLGLEARNTSVMVFVRNGGVWLPHSFTVRRTPKRCWGDRSWQAQFRLGLVHDGRGRARRKGIDGVVGTGLTGQLFQVRKRYIDGTSQHDVNEVTTWRRAVGFCEMDRVIMLKLSTIYTNERWHNDQDYKNALFPIVHKFKPLCVLIHANIFIVL